MEIAEAEQLIRTDLVAWSQSKIWADLGCGTGVFTRALCNMLTEGARIYAIDQTYQVIRSDNANVPITFIQADFITDQLHLPSLDGILMANALHYVPDKSAFFAQLQKHLKKSGHLIIVEYDTSHANPWVPYPIPFEELKELVIQTGFDRVTRIGTRKSIYGSREMYGCVMTV